MLETWKVIGKASGSVDGENELGDREKNSREHETRRREIERQRERGREKERMREEKETGGGRGRDTVRAKRGGPDDELAEMTSRAKSLR